MFAKNATFTIFGKLKAQFCGVYHSLVIAKEYSLLLKNVEEIRNEDIHQ